MNLSIYNSSFLLISSLILSKIFLIFFESSFSLKLNLNNSSISNFNCSKNCFILFKLFKASLKRSFSSLPFDFSNIFLKNKKSLTLLISSHKGFNFNNS